jgi:glycosyltransferase involved in cell wall biosynthesis
MFKVSIVIPVFNSSLYINKIVEHLSYQTFKDFEVIFVVDSRSTDDSLEKAKLLENDCTRTLIQTGSGKMGEARNIGLNESKGEFIWFLDVDDCPSPSFLEEMIFIQENLDVDFVICNYFRSSSDTYDRKYKGEFSKEILHRAEAISRRAKEKIPNTIWSALFPKRFIEKNQLRFSEGLAEDVLFIYQAIMRSDRICYYSKPLYLYHQNNASVCNSGTYDTERGLAEVEVYQKIIDKLENITNNKRVLRSVSLTSLRSSVHMKYPDFMSYAKSQECKEFIKDNLSNPVSIEAVFYRLFPSVYHWAVNIFLNTIYYRDGKEYSKPKVLR